MGNQTEPKKAEPKYVWINCPSCSGRLFRHVPPKKFDIEINCGHCRAIHRIFSTEDNGVAFDLIREPKYSYKPKETK